MPSWRTPPTGLEDEDSLRNADYTRTWVQAQQSPAHDMGAEKQKIKP